jgi:sulfonate transport system ATP-binding protein
LCKRATKNPASCIGSGRSADRVLLIEDGEITLDVQVDVPCPRLRGSLACAEIERAFLARLLQQT